MTAPTVVHHERVETERAVLCSNGRIHYGPDFLAHDDPERVREVADAVAKRTDAAWCGGAPHVVATRQRITTAWAATAHRT